MERFVMRQERAQNPLPQLPDWLGCLLAARGADTQEKVQAFLNPAFDQLYDAALLPGALKARQVLQRLLGEKKRIAVYGDYDVDGVCAAAILEETLLDMGFDAFVYIPDRHEEGYGLNVQAVEKLSRQCGAIITVDCGIVSLQEVSRARELGMAVIVTDHHRPGDMLPDADAVVSPLLENYPFPFLCGAGVAWKLCQLLRGDAFARERLDLCALATVADVVSLTGENRVLVALGLEKIMENLRPGLSALCRVSGLEQKKIRSESIAFQLAPRLNAAGRLESAMDACRLLRTADEQEAAQLAVKLEGLNARRREAQSVVVAEAEQQVLNMDLTRYSAIVVLGENWDSGVVGLSAGKIAEKYAYPTVVLTRLPEEDICVGSARSACGVDIHAALKNCGDIFLRFGGHSQAAGMTLRCDDVFLLRERLSAAVRAQLQGQAPVKQVEYDAVMRLEDITKDTVEKMALLEPFGMGNPAPRFLFDEVEGVSMRAVGSGGAHLKCTFGQAGSLRDGIFFGGGMWKDAPRGKLQLVGVPTLNEFQGRVSAECQVKALKLLPQTLPEDEESELVTILQDLRRWTENINKFAPVAGFSVLQEIPQGWMEESQGTLLFCRRLETAKAMQRRYPRHHFACGELDDPRAYTAVGYGLKSWSPRYKRVLLCDGAACDEEIADLKIRYPDCEICALDRSGSRTLMQKLRIDRDELRQVYKALRVHGGEDGARFAEITGMSLARAYCAFEILCQMGLAVWKNGPLGVTLLPARKCEPEESALYRLIWR